MCIKTSKSSISLVIIEIRFPLSFPSSLVGANFLKEVNTFISNKSKYFKGYIVITCLF